MNWKNLLGGYLGQTDLEEEADKVDFLDKWVISTFKILPSDNRFQRMTIEEKEFCFHLVMGTPVTDLEIQVFRQQLREATDLKKATDSKVLNVAKNLGLDLEDVFNKIRNK